MSEKGSGDSLTGVSVRIQDFLLQHLASVREYWSEEMEDQYYAQYSQLLAMYAAAIRNSEVTRDRNPLLFEIAATELGYFVKRHSKGDTQTNPFVVGFYWNLLKSAFSSNFCASR